jgi:hypothetical protein
VYKMSDHTDEKDEIEFREIPSRKFYNFLKFFCQFQLLLL